MFICPCLTSQILCLIAEIIPRQFSAWVGELHVFLVNKQKRLYITSFETSETKKSLQVIQTYYILRKSNLGIPKFFNFSLKHLPKKKKKKVPHPLNPLQRRRYDVIKSAKKFVTGKSKANEHNANPHLGIKNLWKKKINERIFETITESYMYSYLYMKMSALFPSGFWQRKQASRKWGWWE